MADETHADAPGEPPASRRGLRYMVESAFWFSIMSVLVKAAGEGVPVEQIVFARSLIAMVLSFALLRRAGISPWGTRRGLLALRGIFGVGGLSCFYYALTHLPLADATVIQYTNPAFVALFAALALGERLGWLEILGAAICLCGVALIAQPAFLFGGQAPRLELDGVGVALAGALFSAAAYTTVRKLGETEEPLVTVLWFPLVAAPVLLPFALAAGHVPTLTELALLLGVGLVTQIAQVRMTQGLKLERAARATAMTYLQIVFAFGWGIALFGEIPDALTLVGAVVIVASTFGIGRLRAR